jgi:nucleotide-binding universal stress UspA family protein
MSAPPTLPAGPPFRRLLVPLDDSAIAPIVFMTAMQMAKALEAQVHLLHVLTIEPDFPPAAHVKPNGLEAKLLSDAQTELRTWMASVTGVDFGPPQVSWGEPWRQILDVARTIDVDLIVIGSHRHHGMERVLGTVASKVVNHADRDVLVVHRRPGATPVSGQPHPR